MLTFDYLGRERKVIISWSENETRWVSELISIFFQATSDAQRIGGHSITAPWWSFLSIRSEINEVISHFGLKSGIDYQISDTALKMLQDALCRQNSFEATETNSLSAEEVQKRLHEKGFLRLLTPEQTRNVSQLAVRPSGATFSVPGAGKTTEALAIFALTAQDDDRLLVIAPKNAFAAWDEQIVACLPNLGQSFVRLRKADKIYEQLMARPKLAIIGFQQFVRVRELIADHLFQNPTHLYIDESHRIKGENNITTQSVLSIAHLPIGKLVMSGTPMPQSTGDLVPQFKFLFPEIRVNDENVVDLIRRVYVRTNKSELKLPKLSRVLSQVDMDPDQKYLYRLLRSEIAREAEQALKLTTKSALRRFGKSVTSLLQFVSNPALLADNPNFKYADELSSVLAQGDGPKIRHTIKRTRELTNHGEKVLIWTSFVKNVEYLAEALRDLGSVYIHGGVDAGSDEDEDTREGKIKKFHDDPRTMVLIANPAAASEGISLHTVCHYAIYLDRNFNAAQYLQSEDRIHRLGLKEGQKTVLEIVECADTIDETVRTRLELKIQRMAVALEDTELNVTPYCTGSNDDLDDELLNLEDMEAIIAELA